MISVLDIGVTWGVGETVEFFSTSNDDISCQYMSGYDSSELIQKMEWFPSHASAVIDVGLEFNSKSKNIEQKNQEAKNDAYQNTFCQAPVHIASRFGQKKTIQGSN